MRGTAEKLNNRLIYCNNLQLYCDSLTAVLKAMQIQNKSLELKINIQDNIIKSDSTAYSMLNKSLNLSEVDRKRYMNESILKSKEIAKKDNKIKRAKKMKYIFWTLGFIKGIAVGYYIFK